MRRSVNPLHQMAIFMTMLTGGGCGMMYYLMQKNFSQAEYYRLALEQLNGHSTAMASLGAPPLKVYNLHLSDRYNRMDHFRAQIKIPVTGSKTGGYLFATSVRDPFKKRWNLEEVVLELKEGERIQVFTPEPKKNE